MTSHPLNNFVDEEHKKRQKAYGKNYGWRDLPNGQTLVAYPMLFSKIELVLGQTDDLTGFDKSWEYPPERFITAMLALHQWDGEGDPPEGWDRAYPPMFRRRPNGDPDKEYVEP